MPRKIKKLTENQAAQMPAWREKWIGIGLSTKEADFEVAEEAVRGFYKLLKKAPPKVILRLDSPYAACLGGVLALQLLQTIDQVRSQVAIQVESQVRSQVGGHVLSQVGGHVRDQVRSQVRDQVLSQTYSQVHSQVQSRVASQVDSQVRNHVESLVAIPAQRQVSSQVGNQVLSQVGGHVLSQVGGHVRDQVRSQVGGHVLSQVGGHVRDQVRSQVRNQVHSQIVNEVGSHVEDQAYNQVAKQIQNAWYNLSQGSFWASWCAYISFFRDIQQWENPCLDVFKLGESLTLSCGYVWWHEDVVVLVNRPAEIHLDGAGRLHSTTGPALSYRDGWSLYRVHGVEVPEEWITKPETLNAEIALTWPNIEQRRAAMELYGWGKIIAELPSKIIDSDPDPEVGSLVEVTLPDATTPSRFLQVQCGTGRRFSLCVPNTMTTALEANSWTYGVDANIISNIEERT